MTPEQIAYKEEQVKRMKLFVVGSKDYTGNVITRILSRSDEYAIYEIKTNELSDSIRVQIDTILEVDRTLIDRFDSVRVNFSKLKGLIYKVNDDTSLKGRVAHIISHALCGKTEEANRQFEELIVEIDNSHKQQFNNRLRYLVTTLILTLIGVVISVSMYHYGWFEAFPTIRSLVFVVVAGSIGGFLSVSRRLRKTVFEKSVKSYLYVIYGIERMSISVFGAVIIYFAIRSNLVFGIVKELENPNTGYIIFSIVAGFSETLIPNLLVKLESENQ